MFRLLKKIRLFDVIAIVLFVAGCTMGVPAIPDLPDQASQTAHDNRGGPTSSGGTPSDGPPSDGPPSDGPPSDGPPSDGPPSDGPPSDGPPSDGPPSDGPPQGGGCGRVGQGGTSCSGLGDQTNPHFGPGNPFGRTGNPGFEGTNNPGQGGGGS